METNTSGIPYNPAAVVITGGNSKWDDGAVGSPSISFTNSPTTGFYRFAADNIGVTIAGSVLADFYATALQFNSGYGIRWSNGAVGGTEDLILGRGAVATLQVSAPSNAAAVSIVAGSGGNLNIKSVTESLTIAAAATTVGATTIPAGAILLSVAVRVTTVIPTAATFTYATTVGGTALNTAAVSAAANSTDAGTAAGASYRAAATTITITPNATPGAATGVVRLQYYYIQITPPTS